MNGIIVPIDVWLAGRVASSAPSEGATLLVGAGAMLSVRAQLLYGIAFDGGELVVSGYDPQWEPSEEDHGDVPAGAP